MSTRAETPDVALRAGHRTMLVAAFAIATGWLRLGTSAFESRAATTTVKRPATLWRARRRLLRTMRTLRATGMPAWLSPSLLRMARTIFGHMGDDLGVIKSLRPLPHDAATDEAFERAEFAVILGRDKTDGITHRVRASGASDAMNVILDVHREIVVHDM